MNLNYSSLYTDRISDLIQDREKDYYWLASWQQGIIRLDPLNSVKELQYVPQPLPMNSAGQIAKTALHLVQDDVNNYIWTISWSDLFCLSGHNGWTVEAGRYLNVFAAI